MFPALSSVSDALSSVVNLVPHPDTLTIIPLKDSAPIPVPAGLPFVAALNPDQYSQTNTYVYNRLQAIGSVGHDQSYNHQRPNSYNFEFLIDGTGAMGEGFTDFDVVARVALFESTTGFQGTAHRPNYLLMVWGTLIKTVVLTESTVKYTLFKNNGVPLRAIITAKFTEHTPVALGIRLNQLFSSDLTHFIKPQKGEKLPLLCHQRYENDRLYLEVARANKLTNFRKLKDKVELIFPPVDK